jgi:hypothetical protein
VSVWLSLTGAEPLIQVALRLTEQQAQELLDRLAPPATGGAADLPGAMAALQAQVQGAVPPAVAARLVKAQVVPDEAAAGPLAEKVTAAVLAALSDFVTNKAHDLAGAVRDPADGVTVTVTFPGVTRETLAAALPPGQVGVTPGWAARRRG